MCFMFRDMASSGTRVQDIHTTSYQTLEHEFKSRRYSLTSTPGRERPDMFPEVTRTRYIHLTPQIETLLPVGS